MSEALETPVVEQQPVTLSEGGNTPAQTTTTPEVVASPGEEKPATETPPEKPSAEKQGQRRYERRISRLYREAAEQKARADLLEQRLNESTPRPSDPGMPKPEQFQTVEEYADAVAKHRETKAIQDYETKLRTQAQQTAHQQLQQGWEAKVAAAEAKFEDYDEVVGDLKPTTPWAVAIMRAENGPEVAYFLGKDLKEAQRIISLDPVDQFIEIGKLSAKLQLGPVKPKSVTKAPEPIEPGNATRVTTERGSENAKTYQEFLRERNRELGRTTS